MISQEYLGLRLENKVWIFTATNRKQWSEIINKLALAKQVLATSRPQEPVQ